MKVVKRAIVLLSAASLSAAVVADDAPVYESLSDVAIGPVFFTDTERDRLDRLRGKSRSTITDSQSEPGVQNPTTDKAEANGFIVRADGKARVYRDGDFVVVNDEPEVRFHDEVAVQRKRATTENGDDDATD